MQLRKWPFGIILAFIFANSGACPNNWTLLKNTSEGPFYLDNGYQFDIERRTDYKCHHGEIKFYTDRWVSSPNIFDEYYWWYWVVWKCMNSCNEKNITVRLLFKKWLQGYGWSTWRSAFSYVNKNCDKMYWSSWTKTVNCSISREQRYTRKCVDCDGEDFTFQTNCPGNTTKTEKCHHSWSTWVTRNRSATNCNLAEKSKKTWDCFFENKTEAVNINLCLENLKSVNISCKAKLKNLEVLCRPFWSMWMTRNCSDVNCNSTGERVRTRNCLYGNRSNSASIKLCSNQSNIKTEQCITNFSYCSYVKSQPHAQESSFLSNVGISVTVCVILIVIIIIAVVLRKNKKSKKECIRFRFLNTLQNKSSNQSLSVNEIYNSGSINNLGPTKNLHSSQLPSAATNVNRTFSLNGLKTVQKETPESAYEMALENGDEIHKDINNIYTNLKKSDQSNRDKDNTYNHLENFNKTHCDTNNTYQHLKNFN